MSLQVMKMNVAYVSKFQKIDHSSIALLMDNFTDTLFCYNLDSVRCKQGKQIIFSIQELAKMESFLMLIF